MSFDIIIEMSIYLNNCLQSSIPIEQSRYSCCLDACCEKLIRLVQVYFLKIYYAIAHCFCKDDSYELPQLNAPFLDPEKIKKLNASFWALGDEKWKEIIDEKVHEKGKKAFDEREIGFIESIEKNAFPLIGASLGVRMNSDLYLNVHKAACWHFKGIYNDVLISRDEVGQFRGSFNQIFCDYDWNDTIDQKAVDEFNAFKPSLGRATFLDSSKKVCRVYYKVMNQMEVKKLMDHYFDEFYANVPTQGSLEQIIHHIAVLAQKLYSLHPPQDGRKRTNQLVIQKLFTEYLGHPGIFYNHNLFACSSLENLEHHFIAAFHRWEEVSQNKRVFN